MADETNNYPWPTIDVVIPTYNCAHNISICLDRIKSQDYKGRLNIYIVDGGSTDATIEIATKFGCNVSVMKGLRPFGINGAKMMGEKMGSGDLIWHIDSDNFLENSFVASKLVRAMMDHPECNLAVPFNTDILYVEENASKFATYLNRFINSEEIERLNENLQNGVKYGNYFVVSDLGYGLSNCSLVRRKVEEAVGFYDSDVEMFKRLREQHLNCAVLVPEARFQQYAIQSFVSNIRKKRNRIRERARMKIGDEALYYVSGTKSVQGKYNANLNYFLYKMIRYLKTRKKSELLFVVLFLSQIITFMSTPFSTMKLILRSHMFR